MDKKKHKISQFLAHFRGWIQAVATILTNIHLPNFFKGEIYRGDAKTICVPGLNCYSCPAASGACPIGAFQAVIGSSKFKFSYYITGFFILIGVLLGRFVCGFLCPFGWFQELLHKIPFKKFSTKKLKPKVLPHKDTLPGSIHQRLPHTDPAEEYCSARSVQQSRAPDGSDR